jgi:hypothetical protein
MKRCMFIALCAICTTLPAQDLSHAIGINGGLNLGMLNGDDADLDNTDTDMRRGFTIGAFGEFVIFPIITLQPEFRFMQKGETVTSGNSLYRGTWKIELTYLEIPLLVKIYLPVEITTRPFVFAGPFVGANINANTDNIYEVGPFNFDAGANLDEDINAIEGGVIVGGGVRHSFEKAMLSAEIRYSQGLSKTFDNSTFKDVFTGTISFLIGFGFALPTGY